MFETVDLPRCLPPAVVESRDREALTARAADFLERYGTHAVLGSALAADVGGGTQSLDGLAAACGFRGDVSGFVEALADALRSVGDDGWRGVTIGGVRMPHLFLLAILELLEPGEDVLDVTSVAQLEALCGRAIPGAEHAAMQEVLDRYPVRLSRHSLRQLRLSDAVARQYLPFVDELNPEGLVHTWVGQFHSGIIERMYRNRVIFVLHMSCPVYCRFCFRKHKECRQEKTPTKREVLRAVDYIRAHPEITEVVLTGGDPFMNRATLCSAVEGLLEVEHVRTLRLATRSLSFHPALFTQRNRFWMHYLEGAQVEAARRGKRIEVATHFIHPDELSVTSLELIAELSAAGIVVYVQTPLLGGINDRGPELVELYQRLRAAGAEMHYVFMPCSPLQGNQAYAATLDTGLRLSSRLRANVSDRAMPHFCTATAIGKIDWGSNGWAVEEDRTDPRFLWLRTPYTEELLRSFAGGVELGDMVRSNAGGTLDARFMVDVGDRRWLRAGGRQETTVARAPQARRGDVAETLAAVDECARAATAGEEQVVCRVHRTRVELDMGAGSGAMERAMVELAALDEVTDVVLWSSTADPLADCRRLGRIMDRLDLLPQLNSLRVRSSAFRSAPEGVRGAVLDALAARNRLGVAAPMRVEVELNLVHASEIRAAHQLLVARLRRRGVAVYTVTPLLAGVNDDEADILALSSACRRAGIEFHHLVVAGLPVQRAWHGEGAIRITHIEAIASELRRCGSGRELPRYVVVTPYGEAELGINTEIVATIADNALLLRLLPYGNGETLDSCPLVPIHGLTR